MTANFSNQLEISFFSWSPYSRHVLKIPVMILKNSFRLWFSKIEVFGPRAGPLFDSIISIISQIYNWSKTHLNFLSPNKPDKYKFENFCLSVEKWQISDFSTSTWVKNLEGQKNLDVERSEIYPYIIWNIIILKVTLKRVTSSSRRLAVTHKMQAKFLMILKSS